MDLIRVGDRVKISVLNSTGEIAFIGETHFKNGTWIGVILDDAKGNNDGVVDGIRYFKCLENYGIFVKARLIEKELIDTYNERNKQRELASNGVNHPKYGKAKPKAKVEKFSNVSENRNCSVMFKHPFLREIEKIKQKLKITDSSLKEIYYKLDESEKEISLLKKEIDYWKKQSYYNEFCLKPMENHSKLLEINENFINIYDDELDFSVNKFSFKNIKCMIRKQHAALEEQKKKTLQGLIEVKNILNSKSQVSNMNSHGTVSQCSLNVENNNLCTSPVTTDSPDILKIKKSTSEESTTMSMENIEMIPEAE